MSRRTKNLSLVINNKKIKKSRSKFISKQRKSVVSKHKNKLKQYKHKNNCIKSCKDYNTIIRIIVYIVLTTMLYSLVINDNTNFSKVVFKYKEYKTGDKVIYNNRIWYVAEDSYNEDYSIKLLYDGVLDINDDNIINEKDMIEFNIDLINKIINRIIIEKSRLLYSYEYVYIRNKMNYGYFWSNNNFLAGTNINNWWVNSNSEEKRYSVNSSGCFELNNISEKKYLRPLVIITKEKLSKKARQM